MEPTARPVTPHRGDVVTGRYQVDSHNPRAALKDIAGNRLPREPTKPLSGDVTAPKTPEPVRADVTHTGAPQRPVDEQIKEPKTFAEKLQALKSKIFVRKGEEKLRVGTATALRALDAQLLDQTQSSKPEDQTKAENVLLALYENYAKHFVGRGVTPGMKAMRQQISETSVVVMVNIPQDHPDLQALNVLALIDGMDLSLKNGHLTGMSWNFLTDVNTGGAFDYARASGFDRDGLFASMIAQIINAGSPYSDPLRRIDVGSWTYS